MKIKITQYGYEKAHSKNWDTNSNVLHMGVQNIALEQDVSCAITDSAKHALGAHVGDWLLIDFGGGHKMYRRIDDRAPETDKRVDVYEVQGFSRALDHLGDYADVTITSAPFGAHPQHHIPQPSHRHR